MSEQVFRKKSLDALSAPEQLNDYLHVTHPAVWVILFGVILLIAGLFVWANFVSVTSKAFGNAYVEDAVVTVYFDDQEYASAVETGMTLTIGDVSVPVTSVGKNPQGKVVAGASADIPDGKYPCEVAYKSIKVISLLFN